MERITFNEEDIRHIKELYDGGVRQMDSELGRFFLISGGIGKDETTPLFWSLLIMERSSWNTAGSITICHHVPGKPSRFR